MKQKKTKIEDMKIIYMLNDKVATAEEIIEALNKKFSGQSTQSKIKT